jgi:hypothetical protein
VADELMRSPVHVKHDTLTRLRDYPLGRDWTVHITEGNTYTEIRTNDHKRDHVLGRVRTAECLSYGSAVYLTLLRNSVRWRLAD